MSATIPGRAAERRRRGDEHDIDHHGTGRDRTSAGSAHAAEIERAWEILTAERSPGPNSRVIFIMLHEPDKKVVLGHRPGDAVERAAFVVLVDGATGRTHEAVVSLSRGRVLSWEHLPGVQPAIVFDEFVECEAAVPGRPPLAGGHAPPRGNGLQPHDGGLVVGRQLRLCRRRGPPARAGADVGAPASRRQRLRAARGQSPDRRGSECDAGGRRSRTAASWPCRRRTPTIPRT